MMQTRMVLLFLLMVGTGLSPAFSQRIKTLPFVYDQKEVWFDRLVGIQNTGIVNGSEYHMPFQSTTTHPFFEQRESTIGEVVFRHHVFKQVAISYDIYLDQLILKQVKANGLYDLIQLDKENVESFKLYQHSFKKLINPGAIGFGAEFYDVLFEGKNISLLAKRKKADYINESYRKLEFKQGDQYYLIKGGQWILLNNKKSLFFIVDKKTGVRNFLKANKIKVTHYKDEELVRVAAFLNQELDPTAKP